MKLAVKNVITAETLGTVLTNHSMSLDEVTELLDIKYNKTEKTIKKKGIVFMKTLN